MALFRHRGVPRIGCTQESTLSCAFPGGQRLDLMARKARGPNATSAKVDPAKGRGRKNPKMGLAEEVRGMLPKVRNEEKVLESKQGRKVSAAGMVTLSTDKDENESEGDEEDADFNDSGAVALSEEDDSELVAEGAEILEDLSGDELDSEEDSAQFSDSEEGSEAAEIDVDDLTGIEDVDALEQTDLDAIEMPEGEALAKLQAELAGEDSDEEELEAEDDEFSEFREDEDDDDDDEDDDVDNEGDEAEEIALSDVGSDQDAADIVPVARETINNVSALNSAYNRIALELSKQFSLHHTLVTSEPIVVADVNDDLTRELAFYKQGLDHATQARDLILKEGSAWERPSDYFAEMVKTDDHMERIRKELLQEATAKKASADARRQRELKKFGKQVQINKTLDRAKEKKATTDKIKALKRKRGANELEGKEDFDVALDEAVAGPDAKRARSDRGGRGGSRGDRGGRGGRGGREARNEKFGFGGKKRFAKSNTAESTYDMAGYNNSKPSRGGSSRGGRGGGRGGSSSGRGRGSSSSSRGGGRGGRGSSRPGKSKRQ